MSTLNFGFTWDTKNPMSCVYLFHILKNTYLLSRRELDKKTDKLLPLMYAKYEAKARRPLA